MSPGKVFLDYLVIFPFSSWKPISLPFSNSPFGDRDGDGDSSRDQVKLFHCGPSYTLGCAHRTLFLIQPKRCGTSPSEQAVLGAAEFKTAI